MKQTKLSFVITQWEEEVDKETIDLIEAGYPPYEAARIASHRISERRRKKHADKGGG